MSIDLGLIQTSKHRFNVKDKRNVWPKYQIVLGDRVQEFLHDPDFHVVYLGKVKNDA